MTEPSVLIVGLDPDRVDFSGKAYGAAAEEGGGTMVKTALADCQRALEQHGYAVDLCMIVPDETGPAELRRRLDARRYGYVVIGAGIRLNPAHTGLFTGLVGIAHVHARSATLCFNAGAPDTADCVLRSAAIGRAGDMG